MFIKVSSSGGHLYARLVESFRNENGQPRQRTVATLGRIDEQGGPLDALLAGLQRAKGSAAAGSGGIGGNGPQVRFDCALALGDVWALNALWQELGFEQLRAVLGSPRFQCNK